MRHSPVVFDLMITRGVEIHARLANAIEELERVDDPAPGGPDLVAIAAAMIAALAFIDAFIDVRENPAPPISSADLTVVTPDDVDAISHALSKRKPSPELVELVEIGSGISGAKLAAPREQFGSRKETLRWLREPAMALDYQIPHALMKTPKGRAMVETFHNRLE